MNNNSSNDSENLDLVKIDAFTEISVIKGDIIYLKYLVPIYDERLSSKQAEHVIKKVQELLEKKPRETTKILVDLESTNGEGTITQITKDIYKKFILNLEDGKIAIFGISGLASLVSNFVLFLVESYSTKVKLFSSKEEALEWLKN